MNSDPTHLSYFQQLAETRSPHNPIARHLGFYLTAVSAGSASFEMKVGKVHLNLFGSLHGGLLTTLADSAMGVACCTLLPLPKMAATIELKMNYLLPAYEGDWISTTGIVMHQGVRILVAEATVVRTLSAYGGNNTHTQILAKASSSFLIGSRKVLK